VAAPLPDNFFDFDLLKDEITKEQLKELLYAEVCSFVPLA
jgi:mitogen-activated protein kinase 1/3